MNDAGLRRFYLVAFAVSWGCWVPAAHQGWPAQSSAGRTLLLLGGLGPAVATIVWLLGVDAATRADYWSRLTAWRSLRSPAGVLAFVLPVGMALWAAYGVSNELGQANPASPVVWLAIAVPLLLAGPIPQEVGWRGVAQPVLSRSSSVLYSSLVIGVLWMVWHLPLLFITGTPQADLHPIATDAVIYLITFVPESVIYGALWRASGASTLVPIAYHWMTNLMNEGLGLPVNAGPHRLLAVIVVAAVAALWLHRTQRADARRRRRGFDRSAPG